VRQETLWERTKSIKGIISSTAAILIILSIAFQNDGSKIWTLTLIVSTAAFIHCGRGIFNDFLLGNRATIFIGKISYSWYLMHFPLIKFCNFFT
jgi:peptidoglycan/LPS O-acetylase OafA/YrhL